MARYIDADKLIDKIFPIGLIGDGKYTINAKAIKMAVDSCPTADVAPKSEVEKTERTANYLEGVCESLPDKVRAEVAREIVTDIADLMWQGEDEKLNISLGGHYYSKQEFIAELKKKYTEEKK